PAVGFGRPRHSARERSPNPVRCRRVPFGAWRGRRGGKPGDRQPVGVRAVGFSGCCGFPIHRPPRARHRDLGVDCPHGDLGWHCIRVLFAVPDRVLGGKFRVRHLRIGLRLPSRHGLGPPPRRPTPSRGGFGSDVTDMFSHPFVVHALVAGSAVALLCGLVGYFLVLRGQVFAADALGHVGYTGAMGALAAGVELRAGLVGATIMAGLALGLGSARRFDDVAIGSFFSWTLGLGVLFLTYYTTHGSTANGAANVNVLFGSIFGINSQAATTSVVVAAVGFV